MARRETSDGACLFFGLTGHGRCVPQRLRAVPLWFLAAAE